MLNKTKKHPPKNHKTSERKTPKATKKKNQSKTPKQNEIVKIFSTIFRIKDPISLYISDDINM